jgi:glutamate/tyrosine decarboxylase-like PLP-dependent enzyme
MNDDLGLMSAWFGGPKAENGPWFSGWITRITDDYYAWRRNYFPEDGVVIDSSLRRRNECFADSFDDRLTELLARLKADVPIQSPRYAAHMVAEQTLPSIAAYFAAMLYNPNNVTADVAPVTVRLELQAGRLLSRMIGYDDESWSHLCSGGTAANIEALWVARAVKYLPLLVRDVRSQINLMSARAADAPLDGPDSALLSFSPTQALACYHRLWRDIAQQGGRDELATHARQAAAASRYNVGEHGIGAVCAALGSSPVLILPESHHYCFEKALDILGIGRSSVVSVRVDCDFRARVDDLEATLDRVQREGRHVLAVVAVLGSTEEGSIDPLDRIAALRESREAAGKGSFWLHGDAAYGGYLRTVTIPERIGLGSPAARVRIGDKVSEVPLTLPEHEECAALEAMPRCDSVTIDPHKLGYIPYPAGAICFRSNLVKPLMRQVAPYLEDAPGDIDAERASESVGLYVLEGSKPGASAAAVWLSHTLIPLDTSGHGKLMRENIRNACELHALLENFPALANEANAPASAARAVCLCAPGSNIVCYAFRPVAAGSTLAQINALNRALFDKFSLNSGQRVLEQSFFVSRTSLSARQYSLDTVGPFLARLGVSPQEYTDQGVFLLRSVLMNPWYGYAKGKGRYYLSELVSQLHATAGLLAADSQSQPK